MTSTPIPEPIEHSVAADLMDGNLHRIGRVPLRFSYDPAIPFQLTLHIYDPGTRWETVWVCSRDLFLAPALWGVVLPGMDLLVTPVTLSDSGRETSHLRIGLYPSHERDLRNWDAKPCNLYVALADVRRYFAQVARVVRPGQEYRYFDMDGLIEQLLSREV